MLSVRIPMGWGIFVFLKDSMVFRMDIGKLAYINVSDKFFEKA